MVDLIGIEPMTSSMPWKRAPKLRHRPTRCGNATSLLSPLRLDFVKPGCTTAVGLEFNSDEPSNSATSARSLQKVKNSCVTGNTGGSFGV